jgi:hypothetical protein
MPFPKRSSAPYGAGRKCMVRAVATLNLYTSPYRGQPGIVLQGHFFFGALYFRAKVRSGKTKKHRCLTRPSAKPIWRDARLVDHNLQRPIFRDAIRKTGKEMHFICKSAKWWVLRQLLRIRLIRFSRESLDCRRRWCLKPAGFAPRPRAGPTLCF